MHGSAWVARLLTGLHNATYQIQHVRLCVLMRHDRHRAPSRQCHDDHEMIMRILVCHSSAATCRPVPRPPPLMWQVVRKGITRMVWRILRRVIARSRGSTGELSRGCLRVSLTFTGNRAFLKQNSQKSGPVKIESSG
jgi:hypothetical protein